MKPRLRASKSQNLLCLAVCLVFLVMSLGAVSQSSATQRVMMFNFDQGTVGQAPAGFTSFATGEEPPVNGVNGLKKDVR